MLWQATERHSWNGVTELPNRRPLSFSAAAARRQRAKSRHENLIASHSTTSRENSQEAKGKSSQRIDSDRPTKQFGRKMERFLN